MNQCPRCGQSIEHDFGVVACPSCGAILFVDLDGNLQVSGSESEAIVEEPLQMGEATDSPAPLEEFNPVEQGVSEEPISFESPIETSSDYSASEPTVEETSLLSENVETETETETEAEQPPEEITFPMEDFQNNGIVEETPSEAIQNVADYGNSEEGDGHALQYTVRLSQIESKETRDQIFEILSDVRLGLNVRELQVQLVGGILEIPQLNPVRASVIVAKLRDLPIQIQWRQDAFSG